MLADHPDVEALVNRADPYAKWAMAIALLVAMPALLIVMLVQRPVLQISCSSITPLILLAIIALGIKLYALGSGRLPKLWLVIGYVIFIGGALFDLTMTVRSNASLSDEANPIARVFLDNGFSLSFVYCFAAVGQTLYTIACCVMWAAFLRHFSLLTASIRQSHPRSFLEYSKAAFGCGQLTWRQTLLPYKISELPRAYHLWWYFVFTLAGMGILRWYFGLGWLGFQPLTELQIATTTAGGLLILYLVLHYVQWKRMPTTEGDDGDTQ